MDADGPNVTVEDGGAVELGVALAAVADASGAVAAEGRRGVVDFGVPHADMPTSRMNPAATPRT